MDSCLPPSAAFGSQLRIVACGSISQSVLFNSVIYKVLNVVSVNVYETMYKVVFLS